MPQRWLRSLAWPGYVVSLGLLLLTAHSVSRSTATRTGSALGPVQIQPSEIAKLAVILWAAHVYANKERRLQTGTSSWCRWSPGCSLRRGLVVLGHDLGTALVILAILLGMIWVAGAPAQLFAFGFTVVGVVGVLPRAPAPSGCSG